jgi:hypothetical protein
MLSYVHFGINELDKAIAFYSTSRGVLQTVRPIFALNH